MGSQDVDDMYLQNLEEFVNDENKLVTYKWLSRTLQVHVNLAKQMLYAFVEQQRNKKDNDNLALTYVVAGQTADKHGNSYNKVQVVREEDLEATKAQLKKVTTCHVYSIQKSKLQDTNPLYMTDYSAFKEDIYNCNRFSSITCQTAKCRNNEELESLRKTAMPTQREPAFSAEKESAKQNGISKTKNGTHNKQAGIAGMFSNAKPKTNKSSEGDGDQVKTQSKTEEKSTSKQAKGVMSFFSNHAVKPKKEQAKTGSTKEESQSETKPKEKPVSDTKKNEKKTNNSRKKQAETDEEDPLPQKKRRRIKHKEAESSSEDEDEMDVEEPIPSPPPSPRSPTPPPREPSPSSPIPPTPQDESKSKKVTSSDKVKGKRRKRVQKTKSYQTEDGFFVTEKVWESEYSDCSDDDVITIKEETKVKIESPSKVNGTTHKKVVDEKKKKGKAAANSKQMSMMNFFKKK